MVQKSMINGLKDWRRVKSVRRTETSLKKTVEKRLKWQGEKI